MKETLINPANIVKVIYIDHEPDPWVTYKPAKKHKWFKIFDTDECWELPPFCTGKRYYTKDEILEDYPDYMIDCDNNLVRKDPIIYIYLSDGKHICIKKNATFVLENIKERIPGILIINH